MDRLWFFSWEFSKICRTLISLLQKKSNFVCSRNQPHVASDYNLQSPADVPVSNHVGDMGKCKTKAIQADLGIFTHIHEYSETIQKVYSELCVNLTYPKLWHIQNQRHIENPGIFRTGGICRTKHLRWSALRNS